MKGVKAVSPAQLVELKNISHLHTCRELADKYSASPQAIRNIVKREGLTLKKERNTTTYYERMSAAKPLPPHDNGIGKPPLAQDNRRQLAATPSPATPRRRITGLHAALIMDVSNLRAHLEILEICLHDEPLHASEQAQFRQLLVRLHSATEELRTLLSKS